MPGAFVHVPGGVAGGTEHPTAPEPKPVTVYRVLNSYKALLKLSDGPPKLTPDNFLSWQSSFLTYFRHSVRSSIYDSRESEIKYAPPNCENDPRVEVDQYGLDFVEQLRLPEYSQFHPSGQTTTDDVVFLHGVLSALLTRAVVTTKKLRLLSLVCSHPEVLKARGERIRRWPASISIQVCTRSGRLLIVSTGRQLSDPLALTVKLSTLRRGLNSSTLLAVMMTQILHRTSTLCIISLRSPRVSVLTRTVYGLVVSLRVNL